eukprot:10375813-Lingulodinium_polyedra.AAC.1
MRAAAAEQRDDPADWPDYTLPGNQWLIDLAPSVFLTGVLHVVHCVTGGLKEVMIGFEQFEHQLTHIARLLKRKYSRDRLMQTCFALPPFSMHRDLYVSFDATVYSARWGSLLNACHQLVPLEDSLRAAWDLAAFNGHAPPRQDGGEHSTCVRTADSGIRSDMFWAFLRMVDRIGE